MNESHTSLLLILLLVLIVLSAFFSSSETSMMSLNRYRLKHLSKEGHRAARRASRLLERPDRLLGTILVVNNKTQLDGTVEYGDMDSLILTYQSGGSEMKAYYEREDLGGRAVLPGWVERVVACTRARMTTPAWRPLTPTIHGSCTSRPMNILLLVM